MNFIQNWKLFFLDSGGDILNFHPQKRSIIKSTDDSFDDALGDEYLHFFSSINLKEYTGEILDYIAGYIVENICQKLVCTFCIDMLS